jgi:hypothetical protein
MKSYKVELPKSADLDRQSEYAEGGIAELAFCGCRITKAHHRQNQFYQYVAKLGPKDLEDLNEC